MYDSSKYAKIGEIFNMCAAPTQWTDIALLKAFLADNLGTMAMVNYPYETNFVAPLPAWPQEYACNQIKNTDFSNETVSGYNFTHIEAMQKGISVFYNHTG
jgi:lysosomal Pro-X carboxypeptidase